MGFLHEFGSRSPCKKQPQKEEISLLNEHEKHTPNRSRSDYGGFGITVDDDAGSEISSLCSSARQRNFLDLSSSSEDDDSSFSSHFSTRQYKRYKQSKHKHHDDDYNYNSTSTSTFVIGQKQKSISIDDAVELLGVGSFQTIALIATGLCFMADSMEISLLAFLSITLQREWGLSSTEAASITSFVFLGELIGALILGKMADKYGRRPVFLFAAVTICVSGIATAFANDYISLLLFRFGVGFGVGGLTVPFDIFAELLPLSLRGKYLLVINYFWTAGSLLVTMFAYFTIGSGKQESWRSFVILCTIPCFVSVIMLYIYVPESPRWLVSQGKNEEAMLILRSAAAVNGKQHVYDEDIVLKEEEVESSSFTELLTPKWLKISLLLWGVWFGYGFSYNGIVMAITRVFESDGSNALSSSSMDGTDITTAISFDFGAIALSSLAESIGVFLAILTIDSAGRIKSQVWYFSLAGVAGVAMLWMPSSSSPSSWLLLSSRQQHMLKTLFALVARCFEISANCITWITTAEVLKTEIRTTGHSAANAACRAGAVLTSYAVEGNMTLFHLGVLMAIFHIFTAACVAYLPETKGLALGTISSTKYHDGTEKEKHGIPKVDL